LHKESPKIETPPEPVRTEMNIETPAPMEEVVASTEENNPSTDTTETPMNIEEDPQPDLNPQPETQEPPQSNQAKAKSGTSEINLKVLKKKVQSLDWIVSNSVFEYEEKRLNELVSKLKMERKSHDEEETRITLVAVKITDIVFRIQSGLLTIDTYTEGVQKKITEERETAKLLANAGDLETARGCLARAKIMEKELAGEI